MKRLSLLFQLSIAFALTSCILVVHDKDKGGGSISTTDSSRAYAFKDTTSVRDTSHKSPGRALLAANTIDTKNVRPADVVGFAQTLIGIPYKFGSADPQQGFDCSGFITYVFQHFGIIVPRSSIDFMQVGKEVAENEQKTGDLILFTGTDSTEQFAGHIGIIVSSYNGQSSFIHSTSGKQHGVTITPFNDYYKSRYLKTIRIFPQND
jgi:cell wall-associated NlpC family hydrolase